MNLSIYNRTTDHLDWLLAWLDLRAEQATQPFYRTSTLRAFERAECRRRAEERD